MAETPSKQLEHPSNFPPPPRKEKKKHALSFQGTLKALVAADSARGNPTKPRYTGVTELEVRASVLLGVLDLAHRWQVPHLVHMAERSLVEMAGGGGQGRGGWGEGGRFGEVWGWVGEWVSG